MTSLRCEEVTLDERGADLKGDANLPQAHEYEDEEDARDLIRYAEIFWLANPWRDGPSKLERTGHSSALCSAASN